jgi:Na+/alanine symporter
MWAQVVPTFQLIGRFQAALPSVYGGATEAGVNTEMLYNSAMQIYQSGAGKTAAAGEAISALGVSADPTSQGVVAILSIAINVICIAEIIKRSVKIGKNPYANEVFTDTKDFQLALDRVER